MTYKECKRLLEEQGQVHLLRFWDKLDEKQRAALLGQVSQLDFAQVAQLRELLGADEVEGTRHEIEPAPVVRLSDLALQREEACAAGARALSAGEVGVILVAGGQGTRLGFDGPKGCYPLGPLTNMTLFEIHARKIRALEGRYGGAVPFYIMTSQTNDEPTKRYFKDHAYFGLRPENVTFFTQAMLPALRPDGSAILDRPDHIFVSPDGHGGTLAALARTGCLEDMRRRGLRTMFYFQVDNALVQIADPAFIGLHILRESEMSLKVCAKRDPEEGLGMVVREGSRLAVVEYTELTHEQKHETLPDGNLRLLFGSVAIHVFSVDFLVREASAGLPFHRAHKKVPYCEASGNTVSPEEPNAYKFEKFIFDALPDADRSLVVEFAREEEFSPVKNPSGNDSPDTARRDLMLKHARWLESAGIAVPRTADGGLRHKLEIDPCFALDAGELARRVDKTTVLAEDLVLAE